MTLAGELMVVGVRTESVFMYENPVVLLSGRYVHRAPGRTYDISPDGRRFLMIRDLDEEADSPAHMVLIQNWFDELERLVPTDN